MTPGLRDQNVSATKNVDAGKLPHYRREFQVEIWNRFAALSSIPPHNLDSGVNATTKMIHKSVISKAGRYTVRTPITVNRYQATNREK